MLLLTALGVSGCTVVADVPSGAAGETLTERIIEMLLYPMLIIQTALGVSVLALTIAGNSEGSGPETSNNQAEASVSAAATVRARWLAAINRLRPGLIFLTLVRLVLIGLVLRDLTAFQGSYLALLVSDTPLSVPTTALVLFVSFAAALSIPFTMLAFDGAAGVLLSVLLKKRVYTLSFQVVKFVLRVAFVIGVTWLTLGFVAGTRPLEPWLAWLAVFGAGAGTDWGLMMMHLGFSSDVWRMIPLGVFIGEKTGYGQK